MKKKEKVEKETAAADGTMKSKSNKGTGNRMLKDTLERLHSPPTFTARVHDTPVHVDERQFGRRGHTETYTLRHTQRDIQNTHTQAHLETDLHRLSEAFNQV